LQQIPIMILPEGSVRQQGKTAQQNNIDVAKQMAEMVKTTLGPKGMDKMLVDVHGDVAITNDGATILKELNVDNPMAKMMVEVARTQDQEVGDGTTSAVVIAGELLVQAEGMLKNKIHPTIIIKGYQEAARECMHKLDLMSVEFESGDEVLRDIAETSMTGKGSEEHKEQLAGLVVEALNKVSENGQFEGSDVKIESYTGGSISDSRIIQGVVLDRDISHPNMPRFMTKPKILLLDVGLEVKSMEMDAKIQISDPSQMQKFLDAESQMIMTQINQIISSGANVVISTHGIDETAQHFLAKQGIIGIRRAKREDLEYLSKATGGKIVTDLKIVGQTDTGSAELVEERMSGEKKMIFVEGCVNAQAVTLLIRGGTDHLLEEVKRAVNDAIGTVGSVIKTKRIVGGAGSVEMRLSKHIRKHSTSMSGKIQIAINAFADALESIPRCLAENAGLDVIEIIAQINASKKEWAGVDIENNCIMDAFEEGVVEPTQVKIQAISSATEVANMILRVDDVISTAGGGRKE